MGMKQWGRGEKKQWGVLSITSMGPHQAEEWDLSTATHNVPVSQSAGSLPSLFPGPAQGNPSGYPGFLSQTERTPSREERKKKERKKKENIQEQSLEETEMRERNLFPGKGPGLQEKPSSAFYR